MVAGDGAYEAYDGVVSQLGGAGSRGMPAGAKIEKRLEPKKVKEQVGDACSCIQICQRKKAEEKAEV